MRSNKWPKVSIVTPSYNQGEFLEETIMSVLNQNYPNLEYIIIDGGSTDNSVEIIKEYKGQLAYWVSEPDRGQSDAINKGFQRATGEILAWLNSDDVYLPGAIKSVVQFLNQSPDVDFVYGDCRLINREGITLLESKNIDFDYKIMLYGLNLIAQPASFFRTKVLDTIGFLNPKLNYAMDQEFWLRAANNGLKFKHIPRALAAFRLQPTSKTVSERASQLHEFKLVRNMYRNKRFDKYPSLDSLYVSFLKLIYRGKKRLKQMIVRRDFQVYGVRRAIKSLPDDL